MNLLLFVPVVLLLRGSGYAQNCEPSVFPPDSNSGCCGIAKSGEKTSGSIAQIAEYPWMAIVEYEKKDQLKLLCSAVLISARYVLSGATCFSKLAFSVATPVNVRLGEHDVSNDGPDCEETALGGKDCTDGAISIPIERYILHPEYNIKNNHQNDIVVIRLANLAPYTDFIRPICLPTLDITLKAPKNLYMTVAGWGAVNQTVRKSNVLRRVHVPYVDYYLCKHKYNMTRNIMLSTGQLCAGSKHRDACSGDSGGPLMLVKGQTTEVAGIVSFGPNPCGQDFPAVYTKVYAYNDWIKKTMEADDQISTQPISSTEAAIGTSSSTTTTKTSTVQASYSDLIVFRD